MNDGATLDLRAMGERQIAFSRTFNADPPRIFHALTTPALLRQ